MFRGQYLFCNHVVSGRIPSTFVVVPFERFNIYAHESLSVCVSKGIFFQVALIGNILDPMNPEFTPKQIAENLSNTQKERIHLTIDSLTGRFLVILKGQNQFFVRGDAFHYRQIYYGWQKNNPVITSSVKLFLDLFHLENEMDEEVKNMMQHPLYQKTEHSWFGDHSEDKRLKKLLPNHLLHLDSNEVSRIPVSASFFKSEDEILTYAASVLKGTYRALVQHFTLYQPLTCGLDTRLLLAASRDVKDEINYYIFDRSDGKSEDVQIAIKLSKRFDLRFSVIQPEPLHDHFMDIYKKNHNHPRILPKTVNIQYHFYTKYPYNALNISGNGAGIYKVPFGFFKNKITTNHILAFSGYFHRVPFITEQIEQWYSDASEYSKSTGINILDLFYWEQRMGNWGAVYPFEQDMAIEEFSPYNNRRFLLAMLQISPFLRKSPNYHAVRSLMMKLWTEVLSEPVNPGSDIIWKYIKGNGNMRYLVLKANHMRY